MFNPKSTFNLKQLWNKLGTFYSRMTPEGKALIEKYWKSLFEGMEGLYYDLYQVNLSTYLDMAPGYIEHAYRDHQIVFEGYSKNTELLPMISGQYYYDLPDEGLYLSLPSLSGKNTGQVLYEGVDYELHNFRQIKFLKDLDHSTLGEGGNRINIPSRVPIVPSGGLLGDPNNLPHSISETFFSKSAITLLPSLSNFIIPALGQPKPEILLASGYYEPFSNGFRSRVLTGIERQKSWAYHLTKWAQSLIACLSKPPTMANLEQSYALVRGFPFAYRGGVVTTIETEGEFDYITISVDESTDAYVALGAVWDSQVITKTEGNFFRVFSKGLPPAPHTTQESAAQQQAHDFWLPLRPAQADELSHLTSERVGVHLNGIPFILRSKVAHGNDPTWIANKMMLAMSTMDEHNGITGTAYDQEEHEGVYHYIGKPNGTYTNVDGEHSPLIGYAIDGFPIYGEYGYVNPDGSGGVKKMTSSYRLKSGHRPEELGGGIHTGLYIKDYEYIEGLGTLDDCNGIFAATPEYPDGIYHYHAIDEYPYVLLAFRGQPTFSESALPAITGITNLTSEKDVYEIPTGGKFLVASGQPIAKFDILLSGIQFFDYLTDPDIIDEIVTASGTTQVYDVEVGQNYEYKKGFILGGLSEHVIYTGSYIQSHDINYIYPDGPTWQNGGGTWNHHIVRPSGGFTDQDYNLYSAGNFDPLLPTDSAVYASFAGQSNLSPSVEGTYPEGTDLVNSGAYPPTTGGTALPEDQPNTYNNQSSGNTNQNFGPGDINDAGENSNDSGSGGSESGGGGSY